MGTATAPVTGSGSWPAWMARVSNPSSRSDGPMSDGHGAAHEGALAARLHLALLAELLHEE
jgi:hypothetical protein